MSLYEDLKAGIAAVTEKATTIDLKLDEVRAKIESFVVVGEVVTPEQAKELTDLLEALRTKSAENIAEIEALLPPVEPTPEPTPEVIE